MAGFICSISVVVTVLKGKIGFTVMPEGVVRSTAELVGDNASTEELGRT